MFKKLTHTIKHRQSARNGMFLLGGMMCANILNLLFNAVMGRILSYDIYAQVTLVNTLYNLILLSLSALGSTVNHQVAALEAKGRFSTLAEYVKRVQGKTLIYTSIIATGALAALPLLNDFFNTTDSFAIGSILSISAIITYNIISTGYLYGRLSFQYIGISFIIETITKMSVGLLLFTIAPSLVYLAIPVSVVAQWLWLLYACRKTALPEKSVTKSEPFAQRFFYTALITSVATSAFLQIDILAAAHYLTSEETGKYAILSLGGKMLYFFGVMINTFTITLVSKRVAEGKPTTVILYTTVVSMLILSLVGYLVIGVAAPISLPLLFGSNGNAVVQYMSTYTLGMAAFTLASAFTNYHLALRNYAVPAVGLVTVVLFLLLTTTNHESIGEIAKDVQTAATIHLAAVVILHTVISRGKFIAANIVDLFDIFRGNFHPSTSKKRVLIFNWRDIKHNQAGGAEVYVHEIAKRLVKAGNHVTLFCGNDGHSPRNEVIDGIHIIRRGGLYTVYVWAFIYYVFILRNQSDILIESQNGAPFFTPLYSRKPVFPIIHHINQQLFKRSLPPVAAQIAQHIEKWAIPYIYRYSEIIVVSPSTRKELKKLSAWQLKTHLVYAGIDTELYRPGEKSVLPTAVYVGRLKKHKQVEVLLQATRIIRKEMPAFQVVIVGEGDERAYLESLVEKYALRANVSFKGKVSDSEKVRQYQNAWIAVQPSMTEGWGITNIEANASGTPVIASNIPGLKDSVKHGHTGMLFPSGNAEQLAQQLFKLLQDAAQREQLSQNAIKWAQKFSWDESSQKIMKLMNKKVMSSTSNRAETLPFTRWAWTKGVI